MLRRTLAFLTMMLLLAGCYRQADDSFQTVNSQGDTGTQPAAATPTEAVLIIDPNAGSETPTPLSPSDVTPSDATPTEETIILLPDDTATPTIVIIEVDPATPTQLVPPTTLPTATPPGVITPESGNPILVVLPTATPTIPITQPPGLDPTPTDVGAPVPEECTYIIASGDNMFRIALRNNVELADLLRVNNLSETSIIQPGQTLLIPDCVPTGQPAPSPTPGAGGIPQGTPFPVDVIVHTVANGETLTTIARQYGVSLQAIIDTNNLTNPDRLAIGDQLVIPSEP